MREQTSQKQVYFTFSEYPNYKAALTPPNPLDLQRIASSSKSSSYSHKTNGSTSSVSTKNTSLHGSSKSIDMPEQRQYPATPPQRPPRPARGLFEDDTDEEEAFVDDGSALQNGGDENIHRLIRQSDQAFQDVDAALADVAYNTYVAQAQPDMLVLSHGDTVRRRRQGLTPPTTARRSSIHSTRSTRRSSVVSSRSNSVQSRTTRPPTTKKMGRRTVLLPRKLRWTMSQSFADLITNRSTKRISAASSAGSEYSQDLEDHPSHKRNSSITAAKRQSIQQSKRSSTGSQFSLYATNGGHLTASQMYHRDMLPNSVAAWMGTDTLSAEDSDGMDEAEEEDLSNEFHTKCNMATEGEAAASWVDEPMNSETTTANERPLSTEGSPPPPPPKNPARFGARSRTSQLATIPETLMASSDGERHHRKNSLVVAKSPKGRRTGSKTKTVPRDSLYLIGTAYSKASPLFRHGHIEFHQPSAKTKDDGDEQDVDNQVDWPKFHSSILCGAGDLESGMAQDEANAMAEDLGDWFDEFGFESHGTLIKSGRPRKIRQSSRSIDSARSSASSTSTISDADLPMPASPERSPFTKMQSWSFSQAERDASARSLDEHSTDPIPVLAEVELGLHTYGLPPTEEFSAKHASRRVSSPRMSCNFSDDLGQFLAWNPTHFHDIHEEDE